MSEVNAPAEDAHAGLHGRRLALIAGAGPVVVREGDCYGRVVNVAARVMDQAKPRQVLTTPDDDVASTSE